jgi:hypothetical protein
MDCYNYTQRVERLGKGRHGSRIDKPRWVAEETAKETMYILYGELPNG